MVLAKIKLMYVKMKCLQVIIVVFHAQINMKIVRDVIEKIYARNVLIKIDMVINAI